ncbi:ATP-grasp domain-containing protein [Zeaxanthinibacter enoshimensis]|uniref:Putative ATP-grasp superfamily ATP-dependent carboligase n=1 Tax=Zeaxanthinibacter enoshimensis TaxID=392009 RepID=A0A4R6TND0_9FLAO|nr:ATP-grasp domain-containing protein [Zeaxanthinibacter enoshimensis]TDQ31408.1 putative ATP-grasp superfamily ATP-dependent carboligase [Zeaxanthinibacter enoshimensis]
MADELRSISVLIPDGESFYLRTVLHCLSRIKGVRIFVLSSARYTPMRFSRYVHRYEHHDFKEDTSAWIELINRKMKEHRIDVLMPIFEVGIRKLVEHRQKLLYPEKTLLPSSLADFDTANDKGKLAERLYQEQIPGPRSFLMEEKDFSLLDKQEIKFPVLAKPPLVSGGGEGILPVKDPDELKEKISDSTIKLPVLIQEQLQGHDLGCNVICKDGKILAFTIQKGFLYNPKPFSPQIGLTMVQEDSVIDSVSWLMKSLNWTGVANVDLFYDNNSREYKILEINPRYWNTLLGSLVAGVNFPLIYCQAVLGTQLSAVSYEKKDFINLKGIVASISKDYRIVFRPSYLWNHSPLPYIVKDPLPVAYQFIWRTKNILVRKFKQKKAA